MFLSAFALAQGCKSVKTGYVSHDEDAHLSYISTQQPHIPQIFTRMRQACIRSLSCEVSNFCLRFYCQCIALSSCCCCCLGGGGGLNLIICIKADSVVHQLYVFVAVHFFSFKYSHGVNHYTQTFVLDALS